MSVGRQEVAALEARVVRLQAEAGERQQRAARVRQVAVRAASWVRRLPVGTTLADAPVSPPLEASDGVAEVNRLRDRLVALRRELHGVQIAPPALDELQAAIRAKVQEMAARGRPAIIINQGVLGIEFGVVPLDTLAWLDPGAMIERLEGELKAELGALTKAEGEQRSAALEAEIETVEREEEAQIRAGAAIDRRTDASPCAILGVRVAPKVQTAA
jgi:hypothetical protein